MARATARVEGEFSPGVFTSFGTDVIGGLRSIRGMGSSDPSDNIAHAGTLEFALRNDKGNTGGVAGYYSPNHTSCRSGFTFGLRVRLVIDDGSDYTVWTGRMRTIDPLPGKELGARTLCTAIDAMGELAEVTVRSIAPQSSRTEVQLLLAVIAAVPAESQPPASSYDVPLDTYTYAFYDIGGGVLAVQAISPVVTSAQGLLYQRGDGTLRYDNRHTISLKTSSFTFTESNILADDGISVPSSLANVFNRVRVTIHPPTSVPATVLYTLSGVPLISVGQTVEIWGDYFDPLNTLKLIGGTSITTPIVATTDYLGNVAADGSGADLTAGLSIVTSAFASSVLFEVTNTGAIPIYLTMLKVRGTAIYDNAPQTFESYTTETYGDRLLMVDLKYQDDPTVAQDLADYLKSQYITLGDQIETYRFDPQVSTTLMTQALTREIGDVITLTETQTGLLSVDAMILGIELTIDAGSWIRCRYVLGPHSTTAALIFDDAVFGVFDAPVAMLGYA